MDEPRWLDETEQQAWRALIAVMQLLPRHLTIGLQRDNDLTLNDYEILVALSEAPEHRMRMTELAEMTLLSKSRLSHQITRMERNGLVNRQHCPTDRRGQFAVLTEIGWQRIERAAPSHVEDVRECFVDLLSRQEMELLGSCLGTVVEHLRRERRTSGMTSSGLTSDE
jgi:DNA-binding MarR family transcriptional regulator